MQAKIIYASEIDDQKKQSVIAIMVDDEGNQIDSLRKDYYGSPTEIRLFIDEWKQLEIDKAELALNKLTEGEII